MLLKVLAVGQFLLTPSGKYSSGADREDLRQSSVIEPVMSHLDYLCQVITIVLSQKWPYFLGFPPFPFVPMKNLPHSLFSMLQKIIFKKICRPTELLLLFRFSGPAVKCAFEGGMCITVWQTYQVNYGPEVNNYLNEYRRYHQTPLESESSWTAESLSFEFNIHPHSLELNLLLQTLL